MTDIEQQLRAQKRNVEVDILFELSEELGMYPSKYQRPNMLLQGLRAYPVWPVEDSGYGAELGQIIDNWEVIRGEMLNLTEEGHKLKPPVGITTHGSSLFRLNYTSCSVGCTS